MIPRSLKRRMTSAERTTLAKKLQIRAVAGKTLTAEKRRELKRAAKALAVTNSREVSRKYFGLASHLHDIVYSLPMADQQRVMDDLQGQFLEAGLLLPGLNPRRDDPLSFSLDLIDQNEALRQKINLNRVHEFDRAMKAKTPQDFADALL
jgi:hypothetical protein